MAAISDSDREPEPDVDVLSLPDAAHAGEPGTAQAAKAGVDSATTAATSRIWVESFM